MKVHRIAHCRSGDKGDYSLVSVMVFDQKDYEKVRRELTVDLVRKKYGELVRGEIRRYELPKTGCFIFEMAQALAGGVTRSLRHDGHGKTMSYAMLDIDLPD